MRSPARVRPARRPSAPRDGPRRPSQRPPPGRTVGGLLEIKVNADTTAPGEQNVTAPRGLPGRRRWLAAIGLVLVLACLLPPLSVLARRHVFAESIQFSAFAMAGPAL